MTEHDEVIENPTPEEQETETPAPSTPELNDELVAQYLGVDPEFFEKEVKPQAKGLDKLYAKLNKQRAEQGRQQAAPAPATDDSDDLPELDEKSRKVLDRYIAEKIAPLAQMQQATFEAEVNTVIDNFSETHKDVPADKVDEVMAELGLWQVSSAAQLKKNLEKAYKLAKADMFDPDAEVERRLADRLKDSEKKGEVVEVTKKRTAVGEAPTEADIIADESIPWFKRMEMLSK